MTPESLFHKLDNMNEHVSNIRESQARLVAISEENTRNLREHMARTALLEQDVNRWKGIIIASGAAVTAFVTLLQIGIQIYLK